VQNYRHLIYENLEEDIPVFQDIIKQWLPSFDSAWLICDLDGGYRTFLGADRENGDTLNEVCEHKAALTHLWNTPPPLIALRDSLVKCQKTAGSVPDPALSPGQ